MSYVMNGDYNAEIKYTEQSEAYVTSNGQTHPSNVRFKAKILYP